MLAVEGENGAGAGSWVRLKSITATNTMAISVIPDGIALPRSSTWPSQVTVPTAP